MEEIIGQNEAKSETFSEFLNLQFIPQVKDQLLNTNNYLTIQKNDFGQMENDCDGLQMQLMEKKTNWSKNFKQLSERNQKETDLQKRVEEYKKAKKKELGDKQKTIDALSSAMKEACSKVRTDLIAKIKPVPEILNNTFRCIFFVLYDIPQDKFDWEDFKKKALLFEKGEDFQSRLANFQLKVPKQKIDLLQQIQADSEFDKLVEDPKFTPSLLDIAEWVTFAVNGIKYSEEKQELQHEYDKICRDFDTRGKELQSTGKSQEFWESSFNYVDDQISFLNNLCGIFKGIQSDITRSETNLKVHIEQFVMTTKDLQRVVELPEF